MQAVLGAVLLSPTQLATVLIFHSEANLSEIRGFHLLAGYETIVVARVEGLDVSSTNFTRALQRWLAQMA